ncbi:hypothetical protein C0995_014195 [Termitomyces sp. Mi166|nr:hypothetical protein C0995_014195 [Termitomyces sp. Mi166\
METPDDRVVEGIAKDREVAQKEYESAIQTNQLAGLVNYATDDIFTISVGSIPAHTSVKVYLEYVMNLANDDNPDEIRFQLSSGVGQRYGEPPAELASASRPTERTRIKIACEVQMAGRIQRIVSPSHANDIVETQYQTSSGRPSRRRTEIRYRSRSFLDRDFVLIISAKDLDAPRCFAELQRVGSQTTLALQMNLVPKNFLAFHQIKKQEYLFVLDRSGSMGTGSPRSRIAIAKDTLTLLLRMLPASCTMFNVYIFDDSVEGLWGQSVDYNHSNLIKASAYVDRIEAGGGTELTTAVQHVLQARDRRIPTAIFLLTDGEVHGDDAIQAVSDAVGQASRTAPIRVFTLGIGDQVSTATCERIAAAGNGVYLYATQAESIVGKCARLFRAGRTPILRDVTIEWGIPDEHLRLDGSLSPRTIAVSPPAIQQAPAQVNNVHSGTQTIVFAIIQLRKISVPQTVYLRGRLDNDDNDDSSFHSIPIPVKEVHLDSAKKGLPMIHTLTAWRLIQEHEGKRAKLPSTTMPASEDDIRKAVIVGLGEKYQLVSQYTSFVAIDSGQDDRQRSYLQALSRDGPRQHSPDAAPGHVHGNSSGFVETLGRLAELFIQGRNPPIMDARTLPGSLSISSLLENDETEDDDGAESAASIESNETFSTLSSLNSCDCSDDSSAPSSPSTLSSLNSCDCSDDSSAPSSPSTLSSLNSCDCSDDSSAPSSPSTLSSLNSCSSAPSSPELRPRLSPEEEEIRRQPSPKIEPQNLNTNRTLPREHLTMPPKPVSPAVVELVRLQNFDGSYSLNSLRRIAGMRRAVEEVNNFSVDPTVWATVLAIAFMQKEMVDQRALQNDLVAKAREFLETTTNVDLDELLQSATQALARLGSR